MSSMLTLSFASQPDLYLPPLESLDVRQLSQTHSDTFELQTKINQHILPHFLPLPLWLHFFCFHASVYLVSSLIISFISKTWPVFALPSSPQALSMPLAFHNSLTATGSSTAHPPNSSTHYHRTRNHCSAMPTPWVNSPRTLQSSKTFTGTPNINYVENDPYLRHSPVTKYCQRYNFNVIT